MKADVPRSVKPDVPKSVKPKESKEQVKERPEYLNRTDSLGHQSRPEAEPAAVGTEGAQDREESIFNFNFEIP